MNLYLLRHGLAEDLTAGPWMSDAERPLTEKGERKVKKIAKAMRKLELDFDLILSSPYTRARQTAEIVVRKLKPRGELELSDALVPSGSSKKLIASIEDKYAKVEDILLVGHEPHLSSFISLLVSGEGRFSIALKKGGLCKLTTEALRHGRCATLQWLLIPEQVELIG